MEEQPKALSCDQRKAQLLETLDQTRRQIQEGDTDHLKGVASKITRDLSPSCIDPAVSELGKQLAKELRGMSGEYYFINEGKQVIKTLDAFRLALGS